MGRKEEGEKKEGKREGKGGMVREYENGGKDICRKRQEKEGEKRERSEGEVEKEKLGYKHCCLLP